MDAGRVSAWQLALLLVTVSAIEDSTTIDHWLARRVGEDLWLSILLAVPFAVIGVWVLFALADRHPQEDLAGILARLTGPLAWPLVVLYAGLFLADATVTLRAFGSLSRLLGLMEMTPFVAFDVGLGIAAVYGAWLGIEVVARVNAFALLFVDIPIGVLLAFFSVNHQKLGPGCCRSWRMGCRRSCGGAGWSWVSSARSCCCWSTSPSPTRAGEKPGGSASGVWP